ncbi:MAG TPA: MBL fold metallo-hydrolase [Bryobacteraceae bacterium]|nr:MBL fold metallo-hydrolase [Bryobacteraceae bacterium]
MSSELKWDTFVSSQIPAVTEQLPPGVTEMKWSPISATLISGDRDAVLVDTFITLEQNSALTEWVVASGKNLTTIYATHGHGDHFFGVNTIRRSFPNARFVATRDAISVMQRQLSPALLEGYWKARFPGQIDATPAIAKELNGGVIDLEGEKLISIPAGHTDTHSTTFLHVPSIGLVVAGDVAYNDVHVHLGESTSDSRKEWLAALDVIEALKPSSVVVGHKRPGRADSPAIIEETRQYIRDFDRIAADSRTAEEVYNRMLALYSDRLNPPVLWSSAQGASAALIPKNL